MCVRLKGGDWESPFIDVGGQTTTNHLLCPLQDTHTWRRTRYAFLMATASRQTLVAPNSPDVQSFTIFNPLSKWIIGYKVHVLNFKKAQPFSSYFAKNTELYQNQNRFSSTQFPTRHRNKSPPKQKKRPRVQHLCDVFQKEKIKYKKKKRWGIVFSLFTLGAFSIVPCVSHEASVTRRIPFTLFVLGLWKRRVRPTPFCVYVYMPVVGNGWWWWWCLIILYPPLVGRWWLQQPVQWRFIFIFLLIIYLVVCVRSKFRARLERRLSAD